MELERKRFVTRGSRRLSKELSLVAASMRVAAQRSDNPEEFSRPPVVHNETLVAMGAVAAARVLEGLPQKQNPAQS